VIRKRVVLVALAALALVATCSAVAILIGVGLAEAAWNAPFDVPVEQTLACPTRDSQGARQFLQTKNVRPLSGQLEQLLANPAEFHVQSQSHPLLGQTAPGFELRDSSHQPWKLSDALARGPVVVVFYYGYYCNHCVGQLLAVHADIERFRELGATVVAVSPDPPETTRERFRKHGPFAFPVLADPGNQIAQQYGVFRPARADQPESLEHGTFVVGRDGRVDWAQHGDEPFTGNRTLLYEIAQVEGRLPR
jgi:peroxiredoxin